LLKDEKKKRYSFKAPVKSETICIIDKSIFNRRRDTVLRHCEVNDDQIWDKATKTINNVEL
jgi:hypothetical protein